MSRVAADKNSEDDGLKVTRENAEDLYRQAIFYHDRGNWYHEKYHESGSRDGSEIEKMQEHFGNAELIYSAIGDFYEELGELELGELEIYNRSNYSHAALLDSYAYRNHFAIEDGYDENVTVLYLSAAMGGYAVAQHKVATLYENAGNNLEALLWYSRAASRDNSDAIRDLQSSFFSSQLKIKRTEETDPIQKDQILEIINNLAPKKVRIFNKNSHLIGDVVEVSQNVLSAADLFEIHKCLSTHLISFDVDPAKSKSCEKIRECIAERIKSEVGDEFVGEIKFSASHETTLSFSVIPEKVKKVESGASTRTPLLSDVGGARVESTLDEKLQALQKEEKLTYNPATKIITVTKENLENFAVRTVPAADVEAAKAGAVGSAAAVRGGGGGGGSGRG